MNRKNVIALLLGLFFLLGAVVNVAAQGKPGENAAPPSPAAPNATGMLLTYQGRLTDASGAPINSTVSVVFKLYDNNNALVWTSAAHSITPVNGLFTTYLGSGSDPALLASTYASLGVTVGNDPEMTPRQTLNSLYAFSNNGDGVDGYSISNAGIRGVSTNFIGVAAKNSSTSYPALNASNTTSSSGGIALALGGGIQVYGAGVASTTPVFTHQVKTGSSGNICGSHNNATVISNPFTDGKSDAILIVTPNRGSLSGGGAVLPTDPVGVLYDDTSWCGTGSQRWVIYNVAGTALANNQLFNVMVIVP